MLGRLSKSHLDELQGLVVLIPWEAGLGFDCVPHHCFANHQVCLKEKLELSGKILNLNLVVNLQLYAWFLKSYLPALTFYNPRL